MQNKFIESITNVVLLLLFLMAAVSYQGKLFGHKPQDLFKDSQDKVEILPPNQSQLNELGIPNASLQEKSLGIWNIGESNSIDKIINTLAFSKGIYGFAGSVPMYLHLDHNNKIKKVVLLENNETPDFMESIQENGVISQWLDKDPEELMTMKPDVVSGATITSNAINRSITASIASATNSATSNKWYAFADLKTVAALLVIIMGLIISIKANKNKQLRTVQLLLNTLVLGLWCGKFISLKILMGWVSNGTNLLTSIVVILMLVLSIVMPLFFNRKSYYCNWTCPLGSAQELAGKINKRKLHPRKRMMKILKHSRAVITLGLFFFLWLGLATDIIDYEPFSAFIFSHASPIVITIALLSLLIAIITPRPWCRFVCPTGQILNWTNKMN